MGWQDVYKSPSGQFGIKGPFYGPQGHRGADFRMGRGGSIPAYEHGRVAARGYSTVLGFYLVVRNDDGTFSGWAHLINESRLPVGTEVWAGTVIGAAAGSNDLPGSAWSGAHIHTTFGPREASIYSGEVWDPVPRINKARTTTAGSTATVPIEKRFLMALDDTQQTNLFLRTTATAEAVARLEDALLGRPAKYYGGAYRAIDILLSQSSQTLQAVSDGEDGSVDPIALAKALLPGLISGLGNTLVTDTDLDTVRREILAAIAGVDEATLATFGLKRA